MPLQKKVIVGFAGLIGILLLLLSLSFSSLALAEESEVTVSMGNMVVSPGGTVIVPVVVRNVTGLGGGVVCVSYNSSMIHVTGVTGGGWNALLVGAWSSNNTANPGSVRIASYSMWVPGQTGDVIFAEVTYKAVGAEDNTSALNISVESLFDIGYKDIPATVENGSLSISATSSVEFDTGAGGYPSISGVHKGSIIPSQTINVSKMYTYPCAGTGGHTEYVKLWNESGCNATAIWAGYSVENWHTLSFDQSFVLQPGETYYYEIRTGSYPQIIHTKAHTTLDWSFINCTSFEAVNGNVYEDWIPAIKLFNNEEEG